MNTPTPENTEQNAHDFAPSYQQLLQLLQQTEQLLLVLDAGFRVKTINKAGCRFLSCEQADARDKSFWDLFQAAPALVNQAMRVLEQMQPFFLQTLPSEAGATNSVVSWQLLPDATGTGYLCIGSHTTNQSTGQRAPGTPLLALLAKSRDATFYVDRNWLIRDANEAAAGIPGFDARLLGQQDFWNLFPTLEGGIFQQICQRVLIDGLPVHFEGPFPGLGQWDAADIYPLENGLAIVVRELSERVQIAAMRQQYEAELARRSQQVEHILGQINQGFLSLDPGLRVLSCNRLAEVLLQAAPGSLPGRHLTDWLSADYCSIYLPLLAQVAATGLPVHEEHRCRHNHRWMETSIYPSAEGFSVFCKDIDQRKQFELELQRLSVVAKETADAVLFVDLERRITWANAAFARMTGYALEEVVGRQTADFLEGPETDANTVQYIAEQIALGRPCEVEILNYRKNGDAFWSELQVHPMFDASGAITEFFSIRKDITERKRMELQLELQRKQTTAAIIAAQEREREQVGRELHDNVNQVLTSVKLYQDLMLSGIANYADLAAKSARLLQESIDEIRNLSRRLSAPTLGNIRLKESVRDLVATVGATQSFQVALDTEVIEELQVPRELHLAVYRILQEHLTNILKYAAATHVTIFFDFVNESLVMKVADNGRGFNVNQKRNGIGITNMEMRAESLNGRITINSAPGIGCVLIAHFPMEL